MPAALWVRFDESNLVSFAGLVPLMRLARQVGLGAARDLLSVLAARTPLLPDAPAAAQWQRRPRPGRRPRSSGRRSAPPRQPEPPARIPVSLSIPRPAVVGYRR